MEPKEFLYHLHMIKKLIQHPYTRIILMHPPYTEKQQKLIDSLCRRSSHIIGQIERKPPFMEVSKEIKRLISADHDPLIRADKIQYVVLGRQKRNN
jgi:hypothetical protein